MGKTKEYKPSKGVRFITQNKTLISCLVVILYIVITCVVYLLCKKNVEDTSYAMQIISGICVVGGLVVSVLQYTASCVENTVLREQEKKIKAAEMANEFQKDIIPLSDTLASAYKYSNMDKRLLEKLEKTKLEMFDGEEVDQVLKKLNIDVKTIFSSLCVGYLIANSKVKDISKLRSGEEKITEALRVEAENAINQCVCTLGNKLEYFGICFNSGIADDDTVYQSLHKVYFDCVYMLYIFLFKGNTSESDRLFSNVSSLYIKWHDRYLDLVEKENEERKSLRRDVQEKIVVKSKK